MLSSTDFKVIPEGRNLLEKCTNAHWRAAKSKSNDEAEIIIDLKCPIYLETFKIMNGYGDFGTKQYSLFGSRNLTGPWATIHTGQLPQGIEMTEEVIDCTFYVLLFQLFMSRILIAVKEIRKQQQLKLHKKQFREQQQ